jgi:hypothetical protein
MNIVRDLTRSRRGYYESALSVTWDTVELSKDHLNHVKWK